MLSQDIFVVSEVISNIREMYPFLEIHVYYEPLQDNYVVAIKEEEVYYSHDYLSLVSTIKMDYLWKNKIFNYLFVCEDEPCCGRLLVESLSPFSNNLSTYKDWNIEQREEKVVTIKSELQFVQELEMVA